VSTSSVSQAERPQCIDLFDGPSWEQRDYWDDIPRATSKLAVTVQVVIGILINLMVPAAFAAMLAGLGWGLNQTLSHISF
jgi:hypothetical protein